jgi:choline dehydrogenase-like flavoprotein
MGNSDNPFAVVDSRLRVRGIRGLRGKCLRQLGWHTTKSNEVADTSIMPKLNNGHTQMPAYAIGEKCVDLIKADRVG